MHNMCIRFLVAELYRIFGLCIHNVFGSCYTRSDTDICTSNACKLPTCGTITHVAKLHVRRSQECFIVPHVYLI